MSFLKIIAQKKFQLFIIVLLTFCAYSNIFANGYVAEDDEFIQNWKGRQQISNIGKILAGSGPEGREEVVYRPIRGVFYVFYWQFFGDNKFWYHLHSILVHVGSTVLVYLIAEQLVHRLLGIVHRVSNNSKNRKPLTFNNLRFLPFVTALLFGLHPIHTEATTFMAASMDMGLGPLFLFFALYFYLKADHFGKFRLFSVIFAYLSYFTSDVTLILPALLVVVDFYLKRDFSWKSVIFKYGPYMLGVFAFLLLKGILLDAPLSQNVFVSGGKFNYALLFMPTVIFKYLELLVWPTTMSINHLIMPQVDSYTYQFLPFVQLTVKSFFDFRFAAAVLVIVTLLLTAIFLYRKARFVSFGIIWFFVAFLPVSNVFVQPTIFSERYVYIASFGFCLVAAYFLITIFNFQFSIFKSRLISRCARTLPFALVCLIAIGYGYQTFRRNLDWKDELALWTAVLKIYPQSPLANLNLSYFYANDQKNDLALDYANKVVEILPSFYRAHMNSAIILDKLGKREEAEEEYKKVIVMNPMQLDAYLFLGTSYFERNDLDSSYKILEDALKNEEEYLKNGADSFGVGSGTPQAQQEKQRKIVLSSIYGTIGQIQIERKEFDEAFENFKKSLLYSIDNTKARAGLVDVADALGNNLVFQTDTHNIYFSKLGFSFVIPKGFRVFDLKEGLQITTEGVGYTIEIIPNKREHGQTIEDFVEKQKISYGVLVQHGYINLQGPDRAYARMWNDNGISKSEFTVFFGDSVYDILVYPVSKDIQGVVELLVASLQD